MAKKAQAKIQSKDVQGLKYLKVLQPLLESLHGSGCQRDKAGNRQLHMDHYCMMVLLWLYSPLLTSVRAVQQASQLEKVRRKFKIPRAALGSLSESVRAFDPQALKDMAQELGHQIPSISRAHADSKLASIDKRITAVDGSIVKVLKQVADLAWVKVGNNNDTCGYRLHTQFEILRELPSRIDATSANPKGECDERAVLAQTLESDRLYVMDRGYIKWQLFNAIVAKGSSYVCRMRDKIQYEIKEPCELSEADKQAGVLSDEVVVIPASERTEPIDHPVRLICVKCSPHTSRGCRSGRQFSSSAPSSDGVLRILTNDLQTPAELIGEIYAKRWTIELFFRMFKQLLGCKHLLSTKQDGVEIQIYSAIIACMLIMLYTGGPVTKRTFEMVCFYIAGWATLEELEAHIKKIQPTQA